MRKRGATWDNLPLPAFSLNDIDDSIVERFKQWAAKKGRIDKSVLDEPKDVLMEKLHLMNGSYLTNAAMLLFSKDPEKWQLGAYVKIGFFETDADLLYQDEIHGSILEQIDKIVELVYLKYMKAKISYEGMQRIERYFVPEAALREALLNALCHKQYQSGVPIQISVYEDRLYIANCGCLPENWTLENLMRKHASSPYNPNIAHVFYLAGFIESWGRGIEKICSACEKDGVPQPVYTINPGDIMIEFTAPEDRVIRFGKVTDRVIDKVTDEERALLSLLAEDPGYTMPQLSEKMGISRKTIAQRIKQLKEKGTIERIGSDRNGKVTDDWFMRLSHKYEVEQEELKKQMFDLKNKIERLDTVQNSSGSFIRAIRKFMTMQTLTPIVIQELIDKIEVFPIEGTGKNRTQRLVIHYRFVGCIDLPSIVPKHTYKLDSRQGVAIEYLPSAV